jgi:chromate transporter
MSEQTEKSLSQWDLFVIFVKAGLAFGGGLGILAVLEDELVSKRKVISKEEFLADYAIGRIVPSGTMTALAVGFGYRFGGWLGTVIAITGLVLPAFLLTVGLTAGYFFLKDSALLELLPVTILPAALAFIVAAAFKLGKEVFKPSLELLLAAAAFVASYFLGFNPALLLLAGGIAGIFLFSGNDKARPKDKDQKEAAK